ncbi:truncated Rh13.1 [macacine betaherpesvirus 3]|nr:truncated Rh13.1 [macacine betaherpesvirus 3]
MTKYTCLRHFYAADKFGISV